MIQTSPSISKVVFHGVAFVCTMSSLLFLEKTVAEKELPNTILYRSITSSTQCAMICRQEKTFQCHYFEFFEEEKQCRVSFVSTEEARGGETDRVTGGIRREHSGTSDTWNFSQNADDTIPEANNGNESDDDAIERFPDNASGSREKRADLGAARNASQNDVEAEADARRKLLVANMRRANSNMAAHVASLYKAQAALALRMKQMGETPGRSEGQADHSTLVWQMEGQVAGLTKELKRLQEDLAQTFQNKVMTMKEMRTMGEIFENLIQNLANYPEAARGLKVVEEVLSSQDDQERTLQSRLRNIGRALHSLRSEVVVGDLGQREGQTVEKALLGLDVSVARLLAQGVWLERHVDRKRDDLLTEVKDMEFLLQRLGSVEVSLQKVSQNKVIQDKVGDMKETNTVSSQLQEELNKAQEEVKERVNIASKNLKLYRRALSGAFAAADRIKGPTSKIAQGFPERREVDAIIAEARVLQDNLVSMRLERSRSPNAAVPTTSKQDPGANSTVGTYDMIKNEAAQIERQKFKIEDLVKTIRTMENEMQQLDKEKRLRQNTQLVPSDFALSRNKKEQERSRHASTRGALPPALVAVETALEAQGKVLHELRIKLQKAVANSVSKDEREKAVMSRLKAVNAEIAKLGKAPKWHNNQTHFISLQNERQRLRVDLNNARGAFQNSEKEVAALAAKVREALEKRKELEATLLQERNNSGKTSMELAIEKEISVLEASLKSKIRSIQSLETTLQNVIVETTMREGQRRKALRRFKKVNKDISQSSKREKTPQNTKLLKTLSDERKKLRFRLNEITAGVQDAQKRATDLALKLMNATQWKSKVELTLREKRTQMNMILKIVSLQNVVKTEAEKMLTFRTRLQEDLKQLNATKKHRDFILRRLRNVNKNIADVKKALTPPTEQIHLGTLQRPKQDLMHDLKKAAEAVTTAETRRSRIKAQLEDSRESKAEAEAVLEESLLEFHREFFSLELEVGLQARKVAAVETSLQQARKNLVAREERKKRISARLAIVNQNIHAAGKGSKRQKRTLMHDALHSQRRQLRVDLNEAQAAIQNAKEAVASSEDEFGKAVGKLGRLRDELDAKKTEMEELFGPTQPSAAVELSVLQSAIDAQSKKIEQLRPSLEQARDAATAENENRLSIATQLKKIHDDLQQVQKGKKNQMKSLQEERHRLRVRLNEITWKYKNASKRFADIETEIKTASDTKNELEIKLKKKKEEFQTNIDVQQSKLNSQAKRTGDLQYTLQKIIQEAAQKEEEEKNIMQHLKEVNTNIKKISKKSRTAGIAKHLTALKKQRHHLRSELNEARKVFQDAQKKMNRLKKELQELSEKNAEMRSAIDEEQIPLQSVSHHTTSLPAQAIFDLRALVDTQTRMIEMLQTSLQDTAKETVLGEERKKSIMHRLRAVNKSIAKAHEKRKTARTKNQLQKLQKARHRLRSELNDARAALQASEIRSRELSVKLDEAIAKKRETEEKLYHKMMEVQHEILSLQLAVRALTKKIENIKLPLQTTKEETTVKQERRHSIIERLATINENIQRATEGPRTTKKSKQIENLQDERQQLRFDLNEITAAVNSGKQAETSLQTDVANAVSQKKRLENEVRRKKEEVQLLFGTEVLAATNEQVELITQNKTKNALSAALRKALQDVDFTREEERSVQDRLQTLSDKIWKERQEPQTPLISHQITGLQAEKYNLRLRLNEAIGAFRSAQRKVANLRFKIQNSIKSVKEIEDRINLETENIKNHSLSLQSTRDTLTKTIDTLDNILRPHMHDTAKKAVREKSIMEKLRVVNKELGELKKEPQTSADMKEINDLGDVRRSLRYSLNEVRGALQEAQGSVATLEVQLKEAMESKRAVETELAAKEEQLQSRMTLTAEPSTPVVQERPALSSLTTRLSGLRTALKTLSDTTETMNTSLKQTVQKTANREDLEKYVADSLNRIDKEISRSAGSRTFEHKQHLAELQKEKQELQTNLNTAREALIDAKYEETDLEREIEKATRKIQELEASLKKGRGRTQVFPTVKASGLTSFHDFFTSQTASVAQPKRTWRLNTPEVVTKNEREDSTGKMSFTVSEERPRAGRKTSKPLQKVHLPVLHGTKHWGRSNRNPEKRVFHIAHVDNSSQIQTSEDAQETIMPKPGKATLNVMVSTLQKALQAQVRRIDEVKATLESAVELEFNDKKREESVMNRLHEVNREIEDVIRRSDSPEKKQRLTYLQNERQKLEDQLSTAREELDEIESKVVDLESKIKQANDKLTKLEDTMKDKTKHILNTPQTASSGTTKEFDEHSILKTQADTVEEMQSTLEDAIEHEFNKKDREQTIMSRLQKINKDIEKLNKKSDSSKKKKGLDTLQRKRHKLRQELNEARAAFQATQKKVAEFKRKVKEATDKLKKLTLSLQNNKNHELSAAGTAHQPSVPKGERWDQVSTFQDVKTSLKEVNQDSAVKKQREDTTENRLHRADKEIFRVSQTPKKYLAGVQKERANVRSKLNTISDSVQEAQRKIADLEQQIRKTTEDLKINNENNRTAKYNTSSRAATVLAPRVSSLKQTLEAQSNAVNDIEAALDTARAAFQQAEEKAIDLKEKVTRANDRMTKLAGTLRDRKKPELAVLKARQFPIAREEDAVKEHTKKEISQSGIKIFALGTTLKTLSETLQNLKFSLQSAVKDVKIAKDRRQSILNRLRKVNADIGNVKKRLNSEQKRTQLADLQKKRQDLRYQLNAATGAYSATQKEAENLEAAVKQATDKLKEMKLSLEEKGIREPQTISVTSAPSTAETFSLQGTDNLQLEALQTPLAHSSQDANIEKDRRQSALNQLHKVNGDIKKVKKMQYPAQKNQRMTALQEQRQNLRTDLNSANGDDNAAQKKVENLDVEVNQATDQLTEHEATSTKDTEQTPPTSLAAPLASRSKETWRASSDTLQSLKVSLQKAMQDSKTKKDRRESILKRLRNINSSTGKVKKGSNAAEKKKRLADLLEQRQKARSELNAATGAYDAAENKVNNLEGEVKRQTDKLLHLNATLEGTKEEVLLVPTQASYSKEFALQYSELPLQTSLTPVEADDSALQTALRTQATDVQGRRSFLLDAVHEAQTKGDQRQAILKQLRKVNEDIKKVKRRPNSANRKQRLADLQKQRQQLRSQLNTVTGAQAAAQEKVKNLEAQVKEATDKLKDIEATLEDKAEQVFPTIPASPSASGVKESALQTSTSHPHVSASETVPKTQVKTLEDLNFSLQDALQKAKTEKTRRQFILKQLHKVNDDIRKVKKRPNSAQKKQRLTELQKKRQQLRSQLSTVTGAKNDARKRVKNLKAQVQKATDQLKDTEATLEDKAKHVSQTTPAVPQVPSAQEPALQKSTSSLRLPLSPLEVEISALETVVETQAKTTKDRKSSLQDAVQEAKSTKARRESILNHLHKINDDIQQANKRTNSAQKKKILSDLQKQRHKLRNQLNTATAAQTAAQKNVKYLQTEVKRAKDKLKLLQASLNEKTKQVSQASPASPPAQLPQPAIKWSALLPFEAIPLEPGDSALQTALRTQAGNVQDLRSSLQEVQQKVQTKEDQRKSILKQLREVNENIGIVKKRPNSAEKKQRLADLQKRRHELRSQLSSATGAHNDAQKKLKKTDAELKQATDKLRDLEATLEEKAEHVSLTTPASPPASGVKVSALQNSTLSSLNIEISTLEIALKTQVKTLKDLKLSLQDALQKAKTEETRRQSILKQLYKVNDDIRKVKKRPNSAQKKQQLTELQKKRQQLRSQLSTVTGAKNDAQRKVKDLEAEVKRAKDKMKYLQATLKGKTIQSSRTSPASIINESASITSESPLRTTRSALENKISALQTALKKQAKTVGDLKSSLQNVVQEVKIKKDRRHVTLHRLHNINGSIGKVRKKPNSAKKKKRLADLQKERQKAITELNTATDAHNAARTKLKNLKAQVTRATHKLKDLQATLEEKEKEALPGSPPPSSIAGSASQKSDSSSPVTPFPLEAEISAPQIALKKQVRTVEDLKSSLQNTLQEVKAKQDRRQSTLNRLHKVNDDIRKLKKRPYSAEKKTRLTDLQKQRHNLRSELNAATGAHTAAQMKVAKLEKNVEQAKNKLNDLEAAMGEKKGEMKITPNAPLRLKREHPLSKRKYSMHDPSKSPVEVGYSIGAFIEYINKERAKLRQRELSISERLRMVRQDIRDIRAHSRTQKEMIQLFNLGKERQHLRAELNSVRTALRQLQRKIAKRKAEVKGATYRTQTTGKRHQHAARSQRSAIASLNTDTPAIHRTLEKRNKSLLAMQKALEHAVEREKIKKEHELLVMSELRKVNEDIKTIKKRADVYGKKRKLANLHRERTQLKSNLHKARQDYHVAQKTIKYLKIEAKQLLGEVKNLEFTFGKKISHGDEVNADETDESKLTNETSLASTYAPTPVTRSMQATLLGSTFPSSKNEQSMKAFTTDPLSNQTAQLQTKLDAQTKELESLNAALQRANLVTDAWMERRKVTSELLQAVHRAIKKTATEPQTPETKTELSTLQKKKQQLQTDLKSAKETYQDELKKLEELERKIKETSAKREEIDSMVKEMKSLTSLSHRQTTSSIGAVKSTNPFRKELENPTTATPTPQQTRSTVNKPPDENEKSTASLTGSSTLQAGTETHTGTLKSINTEQQNVAEDEATKEAHKKFVLSRLHEVKSKMKGMDTEPPTVETIKKPSNFQREKAKLRTDLKVAQEALIDANKEMDDLELEVKYAQNRKSKLDEMIDAKTFEQSRPTSTAYPPYTYTTMSPEKTTAVSMASNRTTSLQSSQVYSIVTPPGKQIHSKGRQNTALRQAVTDTVTKKNREKSLQNRLQEVKQEIRKAQKGLNTPEKTRRIHALQKKRTQLRKEWKLARRALRGAEKKVTDLETELRYSSGRRRDRVLKEAPNLKRKDTAGLKRTELGNETTGVPTEEEIRPVRERGGIKMFSMRDEASILSTAIVSERTIVKTLRSELEQAMQEMTSAQKRENVLSKWLQQIEEKVEETMKGPQTPEKLKRLSSLRIEKNRLRYDLHVVRRALIGAKRNVADLKVEIRQARDSEGMLQKTISESMKHLSNAQSDDESPKVRSKVIPSGTIPVLRTDLSALQASRAAQFRVIQARNATLSQAVKNLMKLRERKKSILSRQQGIRAEIENVKKAPQTQKRAEQMNIIQKGKHQLTIELKSIRRNLDNATTRVANLEVEVKQANDRKKDIDKIIADTRMQLSLASPAIDRGDVKSKNIASSHTPSIAQAMHDKTRRLRNRRNMSTPVWMGHRHDDAARHVVAEERKAGTSHSRGRRDRKMARIASRTGQVPDNIQHATKAKRMAWSASTLASKSDNAPRTAREGRSISNSLSAKRRKKGFKRELMARSRQRLEMPGDSHFPSASNITTSRERLRTAQAEEGAKEKHISSEETVPHVRDHFVRGEDMNFFQQSDKAINNSVNSQKEERGLRRDLRLRRTKRSLMETSRSHQVNARTPNKAADASAMLNRTFVQLFQDVADLSKQRAAAASELVHITMRQETGGEPSEHARRVHLAKLMETIYEKKKEEAALRVSVGSVLAVLVQGEGYHSVDELMRKAQKATLTTASATKLSLQISEAARTFADQVSEFTRSQTGSTVGRKHPETGVAAKQAENRASIAQGRSLISGISAQLATEEVEIWADVMKVLSMQDVQESSERKEAAIAAALKEQSKKQALRAEATAEGKRAQATATLLKLDKMASEANAGNVAVNRGQVKEVAEEARLLHLAAESAAKNANSSRQRAALADFIAGLFTEGSSGVKLYELLAKQAQIAQQRADGAALEFDLETKEARLAVDEAKVAEGRAASAPSESNHHLASLAIAKANLMTRMVAMARSISRVEMVIARRLSKAVREDVRARKAPEMLEKAAEEVHTEAMKVKAAKQRLHLVEAQQGSKPAQEVQQEADIVNKSLELAQERAREARKAYVMTKKLASNVQSLAEEPIGRPRILNARISSGKTLSKEEILRKAAAQAEEQAVEEQQVAQALRQEARSLQAEALRDGTPEEQRAANQAKVKADQAERRAQLVSQEAQFAARLAKKVRKPKASLLPQVKRGGARKRIHQAVQSARRQAEAWAASQESLRHSNSTVGNSSEVTRLGNDATPPRTSAGDVTANSLVARSQEPTGSHSHSRRQVLATLGEPSPRRQKAPSRWEEAKQSAALKALVRTKLRAERAGAAVKAKEESAKEVLRRLEDEERKFGRLSLLSRARRVERLEALKEDADVAAVKVRAAELKLLAAQAQADAAKETVLELGDNT